MEVAVPGDRGKVRRSRPAVAGRLDRQIHQRGPGLRVDRSSIFRLETDDAERCISGTGRTWPCIPVPRPLTPLLSPAPREQGSCTVYLIKVLAAQSTSADGTRGPYASTTSFFPLRPLSPSGPPTSKLPAPFTKNASPANHPIESNSAFTAVRTALLSSISSPPTACCKEALNSSSARLLRVADDENLAVRAEPQVRPFRPQALKSSAEGRSQPVLRRDVIGLGTINRISRHDRLIV